jgi:hypothetical protein
MFFWLIGIPDEIEGEAIDTLFNWLLSPEINVATYIYNPLAACMR